jgi:hypothetical protein
MSEIAVPLAARLKVIATGVDATSDGNVGSVRSYITPGKSRTPDVVAGLLIFDVEQPDETILTKANSPPGTVRLPTGLASSVVFH